MEALHLSVSLFVAHFPVRLNNNNNNKKWKFFNKMDPQKLCVGHFSQFLPAWFPLSTYLVPSSFQPQHVCICFSQLGTILLQSFSLVGCFLFLFRALLRCHVLEGSLPWPLLNKAAAPQLVSLSFFYQISLHSLCIGFALEGASRAERVLSPAECSETKNII